MPNYIEKSAYCPTCKQQRLVRRKGVSGGMGFIHVVMSVVTLGVWLLVWRSHADVRQAAGYRCETCGTKIRDLNAGPPKAQQIEAGELGPANLEAVLKRDLGFLERQANRKAIEAARAKLGSEPLLAAAASTYEKQSVVWLLGPAHFHMARADGLHDIAYPRSASARKGMLTGHVSIDSDAGPIEIEKIVPAEQAEAFAAAVNAHVAATESADTRQAPTSADDDDPLEKLRRIGELRDAGILTEDEFAQKKAQLLEDF